MEVIIWITNTENEHFKVSNTTKSTIDVAENVSRYLAEHGICDVSDVVQYDITKGFSALNIIHKSKDKAEARYIKNYIQRKLQEKEELEEQLLSLKGVKGTDRDIETIKERLRDEYFEIYISDILEKRGWLS